MLGIIGDLKPMAPGIRSPQHAEVIGYGSQEGGLSLPVVAQDSHLLATLNLQANCRSDLRLVVADR